MLSFSDIVKWLWWKRLAAAVGILAMVAASWWGPRVLSQLSFFRVRKVIVEGARYLAPSDVLDRLAVDTTASVWSDTRQLERRVAGHPQVRSVAVTRRLPGTLVVHVVENMPVALVPSVQGLRAVDASAQTLPIDPSRVNLNLPVLAIADTLILRLLADIKAGYPGLYTRISDVRRVGRDELRFRLASVVVRAGSDLSAVRFADIIPVENDLIRRRGVKVVGAGARTIELDLRFKDQVIARLQ